MYALVLPPARIIALVFADILYLSSNAPHSKSACLHAAGWSAGDTAFHVGDGLVWVVVISKGGRTLRAEAPTQAEAWQEAVRLAELGPVANGRP